MDDWDEIDEAACNEGMAIKGSFKTKRSRSPGGLPKEYRFTKVELDRKRDILRDCNIITPRKEDHDF